MFSQILYLRIYNFLKELQSVFFVKVNVISAFVLSILISIKNLYYLVKTCDELVISFFKPNVSRNLSTTLYLSDRHRAP